MRYLLSAGGALLLAWTVRFITGNAAGLCTFFLVIAVSMVMDARPILFLVLALLTWILVRYESHHRLLMMNAVPIVALSVLLFLRRPMVSVAPLFLADSITLASLAYRGWANNAC